MVAKTDGKWINGAPASETNQLRQVGNLEKISGESDVETGSLSIFEFLSALTDKDTSVQTWKTASFVDSAGEKVTVYYPKLVSGDRIMRPGLKFKVEGTWLERLDFLSLMLALFLGTAALPHILIRYYTVPSPASARKSTIVAIAAIGFFYILTLFMGLGAMVNGVINPADSNMAAPLLARSFGELLFAIISAIAFATVLGTVSGLIVAASGAVAHDLFDRYLKIKMDDHQKGERREDFGLCHRRHRHLARHPVQGHERHLPGGLAFAVAASANLPAILMLLVLEEDHGQRHRRLDCGGHRLFPGPDRVLAGTVHALWPEPAGCAHPAQQPGHRLHPVELHHAGGGFAADPEEKGSASLVV